MFHSFSWFAKYRIALSTTSRRDKVTAAVQVNVFAVVPNVRNDLIQIAGKGSALHRKHKVYLDAVTVATPPENYEERLEPMFPGAWVRLRLFALEADVLALSKLERNIEREARHDLTLQL